MYSLPTIRQWQTPWNEVWGMITTKINVCASWERFPQRVSVRDKRGALNRAALNHPDQLATHDLDTTTKVEDHRATKLTLQHWCQVQKPVYWSQWSFQCSRLWPQCLLIRILNFLKMYFIIECHCQTDGFCPWNFSSFSAFASVENPQDWGAIFNRRFGCLNVEKWVNNFKRV